MREGYGEDCALILAHRIFQSQAARPTGVADERIVICILGHSGTGTEAAARVATDSKYVAGLYPPERGKPYLRAVSAQYLREANAAMLDNRVVTDWHLIEEPGNPKMADPPENDGGEPRRRRPAKADGTPKNNRKRARATSRAPRAGLAMPGAVRHQK